MNSSWILLLVVGTFLVASEAKSGNKLEKIAKAMISMKKFNEQAGCLEIKWVQIDRLGNKCMAMKALGLTGRKDADLEESVTDVIGCVAKEANAVNDDGTLNGEVVQKVMDEDKPVGNEADVITVIEIGGMCFEKEFDGSLPAAEALGRIQQCIMKAVIDECDRRQESVGILLPMQHALHSLGMENENCRFVKVPEQLSIGPCLKESEDEDSDFVEKAFLIVMDLGRNLMASGGQLMKEFKKIPEIKCMKQTAEKNNLIIDGKPNAEAMSQALMSFEGWKSKTDAETISNRLVECLENYADLAGPMRMMKSWACFTPTFTETCGFNNELSWKFLYPATSYELWGAIKKRMRDSYEGSELKKLVDSYKTEMTS